VGDSETDKVTDWQRDSVTERVDARTCVRGWVYVRERKRLKFNQKNPMIIGMWTRAPGGAAWMQKKHVDSKWFFSE